MFGFKKIHLAPTRLAIAVTVLILFQAGASTAFAQPPVIQKSDTSWTSKLNPMNWSMPSLRSSSRINKPQSPPTSAKRVSHRQPVTRSASNAWKSISRTTSRAWKSSTEFLNPFDGRPVRKTTPTAKKKSMLDGLFAPKPPAAPVQTVGDFLQQRSPQY